MAGKLVINANKSCFTGKITYDEMCTTDPQQIMNSAGIPLRKSALGLARRRGHDMTMVYSVEYHFVGKVSEVWECTRCGVSVAITPSPAPNGIDIAGEALSQDCYMM